MITAYGAAASRLENRVVYAILTANAAMSAEARAQAGITDGLLRLSIGIESSADLLADLQLALSRAAQVKAA